MHFPIEHFSNTSLTAIMSNYKNMVSLQYVFECLNVLTSVLICLKTNVSSLCLVIYMSPYVLLC